jgi:DnaJ-class molecular chaperone
LFKPDITDFLLKGKGIKSGDKQGDHIARVTVQVPRVIDSEALQIV